MRVRHRKPQPPSINAPVNEDELNAFDKVVQQRFHDVIGFGMARISSKRWFVPDTKEKAAAKHLKGAGYELCLFLVGRGVLQNVPEDKRVSYSYFGVSGNHTISGPVFLKKNENMKGLPAAIEMWEPSRQAFQRFENGEPRFGFQVRDWQIESRPVRADDEKCLRCHGRNGYIDQNDEGNKLRFGDTVGMLLYVYKKKSDISNIQITADN